MNGHQARPKLAHSYLDEVYVPEQARPFRMTGRDHLINVAFTLGQAVLVGAVAYLFLVALFASARP